MAERMGVLEQVVRTEGRIHAILHRRIDRLGLDRRYLAVRDAGEVGLLLRIDAAPGFAGSKTFVRHWT